MSCDLPHVQASAPRPVRSPIGFSHIRKTLNPGVPVLPFFPASLDAVGQWPVCCAGASPTEDPLMQPVFRLLFSVYLRSSGFVKQAFLIILIIRRDYLF